MIKKEPTGSQSELNFLIKDKYFKLLKPFYDSPDSRFYVNQLKDLTKLSPRILLEELKNLEKQGILTSERIANAIFYTLEDNEKTRKMEVLFR